MLQHRKSLIAAFALGFTLAAAPGVLAQVTASHPAIVVFGQGGGYSPLTDLNTDKTISGKTGWTAGGGIGIQFNRYLTVRATFDFARGGIEGSSAGALAGEDFDRLFYGGDLRLGYPLANGLTPYVTAGAGAVTVSPSDATGLDDVTKLAGTGGLGLSYTLHRSGLGFFAQATAHLYKIDRYGFDRTQADLLWTGGVRYRFDL